MDNEVTMLRSETGAYELLVQAIALCERGDYEEALIRFRTVLTIRQRHLTMWPRSTLSDVATAHVHIGKTLGEINRRSHVGNSLEIANRRGEIANHLRKAAVIRTNMCGAEDDLTKQMWHLFETVPLW